MFLVSRAWPVRRADNLAAIVSRLSRKCGIRNIAQPYRLLRPFCGDSFTLPTLYFFIADIEMQHMFRTNWPSSGVKCGFQIF
jgi:hypothetical protein